MIVATLYSPSFSTFQLSNPWLMYLCIAGMVLSEILILCCQVGRTLPYNYLLLTLFTLCEGYVVSAVCAQVQDGEIVLMAGVMTLGKQSM